MNTVFDEIANFFKSLTKGGNNNLFSSNDKIPDNNNFNSKFEKIQDKVIIIEDTIEPNETTSLQDQNIENDATKNLENTGNMQGTCFKCGGLIQDGDLFCMNCGTKQIS